jgi:hypothetical protein
VDRKNRLPLQIGAKLARPEAPYCVAAALVMVALVGCRSSAESKAKPHPATVPSVAIGPSVSRGDNEFREPRKPRALRELLDYNTDAGSEKPVLLTPGAAERRASAAALEFLREKNVDTGRFTHARAVLSGDVWDVVLFEAADTPHFGGFEYALTLKQSGLQVVKWSKMQ